MSGMSKAVSLILGVITTSAVQESVEECCCRFPDELIYHALSRNGTTPTDLILVIREWILRPSAMNTNQLIQCRNSGTNIWRKQCEDRIRYLIDECPYSARPNLEFTPSNELFMLHLREDTNVTLDKDKYVHVILSIFSINQNSSTSTAYRVIYVRGPRVYFHILNASLGISNYRWHAETGYTIQTVKMSWYQEGYTVNSVNVIGFLAR